ncbi:sugar MFS transporter [Aurantiacibacter gangjinensis]|uniref:Glucose transporter n=1 Tax=Aurantiacibacter gangjinensis TaxID=502682 RepID=A0A0G9MNV0_9SPHN|nr:sugar MFS transporter [Aurantiacibacter gangjinensis]APE27868.1 Fucose/glucose/galactose permeases-like protein [Aurantiacibacter gangjinensis]KLE32264.1 glucose transporter [Aurantiacibacter gangjinensis]
MALAPDVSSSTDPKPLVDDDTPPVNAPGLQYFVFGLFFIFGGITSLNDVLIPKLRELFTLSWTEAMLIQFCFFAAYLLIGIPGAKLVKKIGYMRGAVAGLVTMIVGCLLFIPASQNATYAIFLGALFILASGVVIVQVVANPLISLLGPPSTTHSRLTFAQAFNSLGTTVFPIVGAIVILGSLADVSADQFTGAELQEYRQQGSRAIWQGYLGVAALIALVAAAVWAFRNRLPHDAKLMGEGQLVSNGRYLVGLALVALGAFLAIQVNAWLGMIFILLAPAIWLYDNALLKRTRFSFGALCIFLYVGAEVSIGSVVINYLSTERVLGEPEEVIGSMIGLYWGGAMVGRFIGSYFLRIFSPGKILAFNAIGAITLIIISTQTSGEVAAYSLLAVGLMNSIMFPTIFSLACEKLGSKAADGSGIINVAIFGGAVVPLLYGVVADATGGNLAFAMIIPIVCYAIIAAFGVFARRPATTAA